MKPTVPVSPPEGDWRRQMQAMAVSAVDPSREQRAAQGSSDLVKRQIRGMVLFAIAIAIAIAIAVGMGIYVAGVDNAINLSEGGPSIPIVLIPGVLIAILGARLVASRMAKAARVGDDWLAPLGLEITSMPLNRGPRTSITGGGVLSAAFSPEPVLVTVNSGYEPATTVS